MSQAQARKLDHIKWATKLADGPLSPGFEDIVFVHQALPDLALEEIDISCDFLGRQLTAPLMINAMTGGPPRTKRINRALARAAKETGIGMAVGSQKLALTSKPSKKIIETYTVARKENPEGLLMANLGADAPVEIAVAAVEMIKADALQLHLNVPQELVMKEGDRDFRGIMENIRNIVQRLEVPVIVKEVGFGLSRETISNLFALGVHHLDLGGQGGTNFVAIEAQRSNMMLDPNLRHWGIPTVTSLIEAQSLNLPLKVIAAGGVRTGYDIAKAIALGANITGIAAPFLKALLRSERTLLAHINRLKTELKLAMLMVGARDLYELQQKPVVITGWTLEYLNQRGIDTKYYGQRGQIY